MLFDIAQVVGVILARRQPHDELEPVAVPPIRNELKYKLTVFPLNPKSLIPKTVCPLGNDGTIETKLLTIVRLAGFPLDPVVFMPVKVEVEPDVLGKLKIWLRETVVARASVKFIPVVATEVLRSRIVFNVIVFVPWLAKAMPVRAELLAVTGSPEIVFPLIVHASLPADVTIDMPVPVKFLSVFPEIEFVLFGITAEVPVEYIKLAGIPAASERSRIVLFVTVLF